MSKFIFVCARRALAQGATAQLARIVDRLTPDNLQPRPTRVRQSGSVAYAIANPVGAALESGLSLLLGCLFGESAEWHRPGAPAPDGSYALMRADEHSIEAVCDPAGSRTLWTYMDSTIFVCSTSQRAILMYVGGFEFDARVVAWALSTGTPGPTLSLDRRLLRIPANTLLRVDRRAWTSRNVGTAVRFSPVPRSDAQHATELTAAIAETFAARWSYAPQNMTIPLSGGHDSRRIVQLMRQAGPAARRLETITWGQEGRRAVPGTDGQVAAQVAASLGLPNRFLPLDETAIPPETVLSRFVASSEGRVDHIAGYLDGMALWRRLFDEGVEVIVRGDEGFGWVPCTTERAARYALGMGLASDYANLASLLSRFGIESNELPEGFTRTHGETLASWRDRMYHMYRIPTLLAALSDIKLPYVELINPLLSRRVLTAVRSIPDALRTNKVLFKQIAAPSERSLPYATANAIARPGDVLARVDYNAHIVGRLRDSTHLDTYLPPRMLAHIANQMRPSSNEAPSSRKPHRKSIISVLPTALKNRLRDFVPSNVDANTLGLRAYLLASTLQLILDDQAAMQSAARQAASTMQA